MPITYGGNTWIAQSPNLARSSISVRNTVEVPELKVILSALDNDFVGGSNIKQLIHQLKYHRRWPVGEMLADAA